MISPKVQLAQDLQRGGRSVALKDCAPSEPAAQEELWEIVLKYAGWGQWLALAMACFFFLTYLAENYLLCFKREAMEEMLDAASDWEGGVVGGLTHKKTGHRSEVELKEGGAAAARQRSSGAAAAQQRSSGIDSCAIFYIMEDEGG